MVVVTAVVMVMVGDAVDGGGYSSGDGDGGGGAFTDGAGDAGAGTGADGHRSGDGGGYLRILTKVRKPSLFLSPLVSGNV